MKTTHLIQKQCKIIYKLRKIYWKTQKYRGNLQKYKGDLKDIGIYRNILWAWQPGNTEDNFLITMSQRL